MTARELILAAAKKLAAAGVPDAEHDARQLYLSASGQTLAEYAASASCEADGPVKKHFLEMAERRAAREPLQYILGYAPFYGREFLVREGVLIPRFDTETIIECVLPRLKSGMHLLDLCTGSGCILLTLLLEGPSDLKGTGSDVSGTALQCAADNAARFSGQLKGKGSIPSFVKSDLFRQLDGRYDIITANPPYIPSADIETLDEEVRIHEPRLALDGMEDGLFFYRQIIMGAAGFLTDGGCLVLETGDGEAGDVLALMRESGLTGTEVRQDPSGRDRAVIGVRYGNV